MEDHLNPDAPIDAVPEKKKRPYYPRPKNRKYPSTWTPAQKMKQWRKEKREAVELAKHRVRTERWEEKKAERLNNERAQALEDFVAKETPPPETIDLNSVDVCTYVSKVIFSCEMDYGAAARKMRPRGDWVSIVAEMNASENLRIAMDRLFKSIGIDDASRNAFVKSIWIWFYGDDNEKSLQASRILAKIFFAENAEKDVPDTLKIEGMEEGLKKMMGTETKTEEPVIQTDAYVLLEGRHE